MGQRLRLGLPLAALREAYAFWQSEDGSLCGYAHAHASLAVRACIALLQLLALGALLSLVAADPSSALGNGSQTITTLAFALTFALSCALTFTLTLIFLQEPL